MSNTSKVVHPFFQQQQQQRNKKASSPTTPLPSQIPPADDLPQYTPPVPVIQQPRLRPRKPVSVTAVSKTTALEHVPAVASCSTPYYLPIVKPKFLSDTLQQSQNQSEFNFYGRIKPAENIYDHEFSRFDRNVFDNGHIKQDPPVYLSELSQPSFTQQNYEIKLDDITTDFFSKRLGKQRSSQPNVKKPKYHINITNQEELQSFLDRSFPNWHTFSSCVILSQIVFNRTNEKKKNQQKQWVDEYRPKSVYGLLGDRHNSIYLKDWLHQMKIAPMSAPTTNQNGIKKSKLVKKKKLADDLGLLSLAIDDDDDFMPTKKTAKQLKNESIKSNIILVAGDHGVGKTTMIYTVAEQLGYEVFEINPGSRRSGKDIMSMVGEMTKSHHVTFGIQQQSAKEEDINKPKKRRLNPCLSSSLNKPKSDNGLLKSFLRKKPLSEKVKVKTSNSPEPKQSLILLEEVDLLFEDDKAFWSSIIELSQKSKRPIVMTCNDPDQVPFESLYLQVILEMKPPTDNELLPYLWLLCYAEGYIVDPADLICLMAFMGRDIRQLIQTLELYAKSEEPIFESYMGIHLNESLASMKLKCIPSRVAIDTFRLSRCYENIGDTKMTDDDDVDELEKIERALHDNALVDSWLGWKGNGNMIHEASKDEINGFTTLWLEEDDAYESNNMLKEIESSISVMHSEEMKSSVWSNIICDESSHWDEACDSKSNNFIGYTDAIKKLLSTEMTCQPNESIIMEYVSYIRQMISADSKVKAVKTRSKRKRLYLPLNEDDINSLSQNRTLIDETEFWINRLCKLKKESRNA